MGIEVIDNQPIHLTPPGDSVDCKDCGGQACTLIQYADYLYLQLKMTPCGDDFICGQPVASDELVQNGGFDGTTGWEEAGNNWTIASNKACYTAADGAGVLYQTIADLEEGCRYQLSYTISDYVAGTLRPFLWSTAGTIVSADGDYSEIITIAPGHLNEFLDFVDIGWNGCITSISLIALPCCWHDADLSVTYTINGACVNGSIDGTGTIFTDTLLNTPGYYFVSFSISNYVSGTVQVQRDCSDTFVGGPFSLNGEKFAYGSFGAPGTVCFRFTDFTGCISDVHLYKLNIPQFIMQSQTTGTQYYEVNDGSFLNFTEDRITLKFRPLEFLFTDCYKICIVDTCRIAGPTNKVTNGTFDSDLADWSAGSGWSWDGTNGGQALFERASGTGALSQTFSVPDIQVCIQVTVTDISTFLNSFLRVHLYNAASASVTFLDITAAGTYTICGIGARLDLEPSNIANTVISVDNVGVFQITDCDDCNPFDYCSNCIKFVAEQNGLPCTLLVEAYNDENGSWDFVWNNSAGANIFKLQHRLDATLGNPKYPEDSVDYTYSTGETKDTFAQSEKFWTLHVNEKDEIAHDCIRLQKRSDHLFITDENGNRKEYWAEKGDYAPKWVEPAGSNLAPAEFRVKLKNKTLYNNLCS